MMLFSFTFLCFKSNSSDYIKLHAEEKRMSELLKILTSRKLVLVSILFQSQVSREDSQDSKESRKQVSETEQRTSGSVTVLRIKGRELKKSLLLKDFVNAFHLESKAKLGV